MSSDRREGHLEVDPRLGPSYDRNARLIPSVFRKQTSRWAPLEKGASC